jgi:hypothetical protein
MTDSGGGHDFGTLSTSSPSPLAWWDHATLSFDYLDGGCYCADNMTAAQAICNDDTYYIDEHEATCASTPIRTFSVGTYGTNPTTSCDIVQYEGWTPLFQGTCKRRAVLSVWWMSYPVCQ